MFCRDTPGILAASRALAATHGQTVHAWRPVSARSPVVLSAWASRLIEFATCGGEIRAAMRVLLASQPDEPRRYFIRYVRKRLLEVGAPLPTNLRA